VVKWSNFKACGARGAKKPTAAARHPWTMSLLSLGFQQFLLASLSRPEPASAVR
jgi:hypothetical protein